MHREVGRRRAVLDLGENEHIRVLHARCREIIRLERMQRNRALKEPAGRSNDRELDAAIPIPSKINLEDIAVYRFIYVKPANPGAVYAVNIPVCPAHDRLDAINEEGHPEAECVINKVYAVGIVYRLAAPDRPLFACRCGRKPRANADLRAIAGDISGRLGAIQLGDRARRRAGGDNDLARCVGRDTGRAGNDLDIAQGRGAVR